MKASIGAEMQRKSRAGAGINLTLLMSVALILAGLTVAFNALFGQREQFSGARTTGSSTDILTAGSGTQTGYADSVIQSARARIEADAGDYQAYGELGLAYQQKARETNDPSYYTQAQDALEKSLAIKPDYYDATAGMGNLLLSLHEFSAALEWGQKAQAILPGRAYSYGVMGDAQIELGEYEAAVASFQKMVDLRPDLSSYSRVSYARELYGDTPGAIAAMQSAIAAGGPSAENTAWCRFQLGNLYFNSGKLAEAESIYTEALQAYPNYLHAYAGMGQVRWAQGRTDEAIEYYKQAVATVPLPQYLTALGDLYTVSGDAAAAKEQYDLVLYIFQVFDAGGVNVDIEKAAFLADHNMDTASAVTLAERAAEGRHDVQTLDTLAWTYYRAGRYSEAEAAMQKAMRLGTQNAVFYFHLGMIQQALGKTAESTASIEKSLSLNPHFSILHAAQAASMVRK